MMTLHIALSQMDIRGLERNGMIANTVSRDLKIMDEYEAMTADFAGYDSRRRIVHQKLASTYGLSPRTIRFIVSKYSEKWQR